MRSHKVLFLAGAVLALTALAMIWGCGDDDDTSTNWGSLQDPDFKVVSDQFEALVDSTVTQFGEGLGAIQMLPAEGDDPAMYGPGDPDGETDVLEVNYTAGWHIIQFEWHNQLGYVAAVNDSIQFLRNGQPTQEGTNLEQLRFRRHWSWTAPDTTVTYVGADGHSQFDFDGLDGQLATVNGTSGFSVETKQVSVDSVVHRDISIDAAVVDVNISKTGITWDQGCPTSGQISATITMVYEHEGETQVETIWDFTATFENGTISIVATSRGYTWSYERDVCNPPA